MYLTRNASNRSRLAVLSAAMTVALAVPTGSFAASSYDMAAITSDIYTLQAQSTPMPSGIAALPADQHETTGRLDSLYNFIEGVSSLQGPSAGAGTNPEARINVADLWKAAKTVYNTFDARCTYWTENAGPPIKRVTLDMVSARIEALETGAQITGMPAARERVTMAQVEALIVKLQDFTAGLSAMPSYRPWENNPVWRMNLKSLTESMDTFYDQASVLCADLRS